jgi:hypothetical protein
MGCVSKPSHESVEQFRQQTRRAFLASWALLVVGLAVAVSLVLLTTPGDPWRELGMTACFVSIVVVQLTMVFPVRCPRCGRRFYGPLFSKELRGGLSLASLRCHSCGFKPFK